MKRLILIIASALALTVVSCTKESAGVTRITYYPTITLQGANPFIMTVGDAYVDPGFKAEMGGEDIADQVKVDKNFDGTSGGIFTVKYSAVNADGISSSAKRTVYVLNSSGPDGVYLSTVGSYSNMPISVSVYSPGVYLIEDLCGGYYCYGRYPGYEPTYDFHAEGYFTVAADGTMTLVGAEDWYFYSQFDYSNFAGKYNAATDSYSFNFDGIPVSMTPFVAE